MLSLAFPFTLGQFTIAFSLVLILLQILMLRKRFRPEHLLQIPISVAFGYFIDLTMLFVAHIPMPSYPVKVGFLLAGCALLAVGVYLEMIADVAMLPGESFVRAVTQVFHTDFGLTKVCFDVGMTVTAGILSVVLISVAQRCAGGKGRCRRGRRADRPRVQAAVCTAGTDALSVRCGAACILKNKRE